MAQVLEFRFSCLGLRFSGSGFRVEVFRLRVHGVCRIRVLGVRV